MNDGVAKEEYLSFVVKLTFPKVDDRALRIYQLGLNCCVFKVDLSHYFRQLQLDPADYSMVGIIIGDNFYFAKVLPMGMHTTS